jgi:hypothetical protein
MNININSVDDYDRHNSVTMGNLLTPRSGHGNNSNVLSLKHRWRGIECDVVDVDGVFVVRE